MIGDDRVAIVTGASGGIGRQVAVAIAGRGMRVVGSGRSVERLADVRSELGRVGAAERFRPVAGDVRDPACLDALFAVCEEAFGPPHVFVVNAGSGLPGSVLGADAERWPELFDLNCVAALRQLQMAGRRLRAAAAGDDRRRRHIVVIGSVVGENVGANAVYGATKAALHLGTEALRRELAPAGVGVTLVQPGFVKTGFQRAAGYDLDAFAAAEREAGPFLTAEDIAECVQFVLDRPAHVCVGDLTVRPIRQAYP